MKIRPVSKKINQFFSRPYPLLITEEYCWLYICVVSVIIALLINFQQPFGLHAWVHPYKWLILSGFGGVYAIVNIILYSLFPLLFPRFFIAGDWTVAREIICLVVLFFTAGILNWLHALYSIPYFIASGESFLQMQFNTFTFGSLPVISLALFVQIQNILNSTSTKKEGLEEKEELQTLMSGKEMFHFNGMSFLTKDILYVHANQNYVEIHYFTSGKKEKKVYRSTIKLVESYLTSFPQFVRCHKSYVVNVQLVINSKGNSGRMELQLQNCIDKIPVSRNFVPRIKQVIKVT